MYAWHLEPAAAAPSSILPLPFTSYFPFMNSTFGKSFFFFFSLRRMTSQAKHLPTRSPHVFVHGSIDATSWVRESRPSSFVFSWALLTAGCPHSIHHFLVTRLPQMKTPSSIPLSLSLHPPFLSAIFRKPSLSWYFCWNSEYKQLKSINSMPL